MAKKNKNTESKASETPSPARKRRKPKPNYKKAVMVGVLFLVMLSFILTSIPNFGGSGSKAASVKTPVNSNAPAPRSTTSFTKQGSLTINRQTNPEPLAVDIEVADTEAKRNQGLMFRRHMEPHHGMLFIMERLKEQNFFMRNTYISLDIIYLDENKKIVSIAKNTETLNDNSIPSNGNALYVLEVVAGYSETHGLQVGDQMEWTLD